MLGLSFGLFGRSRELQQLDRAVRAVGLHPRLMPEAVKLTAIKLSKAARRTADLPPDAYAEAAELLAYCQLGAAAFEESNDAQLSQGVEARLAAALVAGDSLDAQLVLLSLHAGTIERSVVERFQLEVG